MLANKLAKLSLLLVCVACLAPAMTAQRGGSPGRGGGGGQDRETQEIKPYDEVITADARTDVGLFTVHRVDDKVYYEIPEDALGLEMLWVTQIAQTQAGHGFGGTSVGNRVVRWIVRDEDILLRDVKYTLRATSDDTVANSVASTSMEPIIASYPVKAWGKDKAAVIDVTDLYLGDLPEFSARRRLNASGVDRQRSFVEQVRSFPENIESKVLVTYRLSGDTGNRGGRGRRGGRGGRPDPSQGAVTVLLHHSMVKLPENPMPARIHDARVGFFSVSFQEFASGEHQVNQMRYITRWRLEKQDPDAEVSDPIKPIVFHVGRGVPEKWRASVKAGIEAWQPAFAAAGFSNAIIAVDAPTVREDPDWDAEDARYSTIRWLPSATENAMGPHVHDPRTGEILESDIIVYHNVLKLVRDWYFVQASPMDPRAQQLPLPDNLMGELLAYVISHEVGHTLGFPHNMKASSSYTVEQLRDPIFTETNGTEASIMDYGRFNYVAQPGDDARLIPIIGPYDFFAVDWGYRTYPDAKTPEAEKPNLEALVARQVGDPTLRFGDPNAAEDPSQQTEDLSSDPIAATALGLRNLALVAANLVRATCKPGEDYELLRNMYDQVVSQRNRELGHVANVVGGMSKQNLWYGQADRVFIPESRARQQEAVEFLNRHAFQTPRELLDQDILWRLETSGAADRILNGQRRLLTTLINDRRIKRMAEHAALVPDEAYLGTELMTDLRNSIWSELAEDQFAVDLYRRNLQRAHVEVMGGHVNNDDASTDLPALSRGQLETILQLINERGSEAGDEITWMHLNDLKARIQKALDPKPRASAADGR
jgi:hypothetical protein